VLVVVAREDVSNDAYEDLAKVLVVAVSVVLVVLLVMLLVVVLLVVNVNASSWYRPNIAAPPQNSRGAPLQSSSH
jgi:hypothetical protein